MCLLYLVCLLVCLLESSLKIPAWSNRRNLVQENSVQISVASYLWDLDEMTVNLFTVTPGKLSWPFLLSWHLGRGPEAGKQNMKCLCILKNSASSTLSICKRICKGSKFFWKRGEWKSASPHIKPNACRREFAFKREINPSPHPWSCGSGGGGGAQCHYEASVSCGERTFVRYASLLQDLLVTLPWPFNIAVLFQWSLSLLRGFIFLHRIHQLYNLLVL